MKRLFFKVVSLFIVASMFYGCESQPSVNNGDGGEDTSDDMLEGLAEEREILIQFYRDTDGDNWTNNENWCSDKPIDEWYGVSVNDGHMDYDNHNWVEERWVSIYLDDNNLKGSGSLAGMETLYHLSCWRNDLLTSLDVSGCTTLETLYCPESQLTSLDVSGCTSLMWADCFDNQLTSLNVSGCTALDNLDCYNNLLPSLDVSGCKALKELECHNNRLVSLNCSDCTALEDLYCDDNCLTSLNVSGCPALKNVYCENNRLTQEIAGIFDQLLGFVYDERYEYWTEYIDGGGTVDHYKDNGVGWWYPGEPEKGYHGK